MRTERHVKMEKCSSTENKFIFELSLGISQVDFREEYVKEEMREERS